MTLGDRSETAWISRIKMLGKNERTPTPVRCFAVRLHSMGLSVREVETVLGWLGVDRSHGAV